MKTIKELLSEENARDSKSKAFLTRQKLDSGKYILLPGYTVDYIEQDGVERTVFKHELYTQGQAGFNARQTKARRKFDVHHEVSQSDIKKTHSVIDET